MNLKMWKKERNREESHVRWWSREQLELQISSFVSELRYAKHVILVF